jgi:hypothetical protein
VDRDARRIDPTRQVIRFCVRFSVGPLFVPAGEPPFNGGVEDFDGWFQPRLFGRRHSKQRPRLAIGVDVPP